LFATFPFLFLFLVAAPYRLPGMYEVTAFYDLSLLFTNLTINGASVVDPDQDLYLWIRIILGTQISIRIIKKSGSGSASASK
jgi:hypothetical protein